ncbi:hypothetical protein [Spirosoma validum]|uniref:Uncharacterized protein n=1 Tax=Spirosoma validum TaxID=2771355 RepID=A0A927B464_9BACT|nr:hypothetical protein [Spirosoma validum]MBD2755085.1 hypothetical protein [Spirosoma validum]
MNAFIKSTLIPGIGDPVLPVAPRSLFEQTDLLTGAFLLLSFSCLLFGVAMLIAVLAARLVYWARHGRREKRKHMSPSWPGNGLDEVQATSRLQLKQE